MRRIGRLRRAWTATLEVLGHRLADGVCAAPVEENVLVCEEWRARLAGWDQYLPTLVRLAEVLDARPSKIVRRMEALIPNGGAAPGSIRRPAWTG